MTVISAIKHTKFYRQKSMEEINSFSLHLSNSNYSLNVGKLFYIAICDLLAFIYYHMKDTNKYITVEK